MGLLSKLFGGSKQSNQSTSQQSSVQESSGLSFNQAYPQLKSDYGGGANYYQQSGNMLQSLLGGGFDQYKKNTGYDFLQNQGMNKIMGSLAGRGVFQSGATGKGLVSFANNLAQQSFGGYLENLLKQAGLGLGAGQLLSGAGNVSSSNSYGTSSGTSTSSGTGTNSNGVGGFLGGLLSFI